MANSISVARLVIPAMRRELQLKVVKLINVALLRDMRVGSAKVVVNA
jgi:hypothetical protein